MVRAVRFASRFGFPIDLDTQQAIRENAETLFPAVAMERIWNEFTKMSKYPRFEQAILEMHHLGLLQVIFPQLKTCIFMISARGCMCTRNFQRIRPQFSI